MATVTQFTNFRKDLVEGKHDFTADTLKVFLIDTAPTVASAGYADLSATEIAAGNGYTTGGVTATVDSTFPTTLSGVSWTASGGDIATHRYGVLYNDTAAGKNLIAYADYGVSAVIANGNSDSLNGTWFSA